MGVVHIIAAGRHVFDFGITFCLSQELLLDARSVSCMLELRAFFRCQMTIVS